MRRVAMMGRAARAEYRKSAREGQPPGPPAGVDWRPIDGFPGYAIARDKSVWSASWVRGGKHDRWRRVAWVMRGRNKTCPTVIIWDAEGRPRFRPVERLYREAYVTPRLPDGDPGLEEIEDVDDQAEDQALGMPPVPPLPSRPAIRSLPVEPVHSPVRQPVKAPDPTPLPPPPVVETLSFGPHARGSDSASAKLDEDKVRELRALFPSVGAPSLAVRYGVTETTIYNAAKGKTWGHVPGALG